MTKLLMLIFAVGFLLRVVFLSYYPIGFTPDEASFGYDAFSILKTGSDQWGHKWPLVLESFGDFKSPLMAYLMVPSVFLFGLSKFSVRLPNAILSSIVIMIVYFLSQELAKYLKLNKRSGIIFSYSSSLFIAISPWHIMLSRGAFEANLTSFFLPLAILLFLKGLKKSPYLIISFLVFGINLFTYHAAKFITPLALILGVVLFRKELINIPKKFLYLSSTIFIFLMGITVFTFSQGGSTRALDINVLNISLKDAARERIVATNFGLPDTISRAFHNKYQVSLRKVVQNYSSYFSPQFLFTQGPAETTYGMIPGRGVLYWFYIPLVFFSLGYIKRLEDKRLIVLMLGIILLAPLPASLATGPGYAGNRVAGMMPFIELFLALGALSFYEFLLTKKYLLVTYACFSLISFVFFIEDYFIQSRVKLASGMLYGNYEVATWLAKDRLGDKEVVVSRRLSEPHIYVAFANRLDPRNYQENTVNWDYRDKGLGWVDQMGEYGLGNYIFRNIDWQVDSRRTSSLLVGKPEEFPEEVIPTKTFYYPDGSKSILVVDTKSYEFAVR